MQLTSAPSHAAKSQDDARDVAWLVLAVASLAGLVALTIALAAGIAFPFDPPLLAFARTWDGWPFLWQAVSQSANIPLIVIGIGFVLWLLKIGRRREALLVVVVLIAVTGGSEGIKQLTARPRPSGSGDGIPGVIYSYPSGHVLESLTILGMVTLRFWRTSRRGRLRVLLVAAVTVEVILVGIARLALNEHYPTDLLGGLLGALVALGSYAWLTRPGGWADRPPARPQ